MRVQWRGLELPARVIRDENVSTPEYGKFSIEPFERGFGTTVGNSLRRILLSSIEGSAITQVRIAGADHEFCSLPGVYEDVVDIILNIKGIIVDVDGDQPQRLRLERREKGEIRAGDFACDPGVMVYNPDQLVCTLTDNVPFSCELLASRGRGYIPALEHAGDNQELGIIPIDALYSPVTRVRYRIEDTRVGQKTNYDRLILEIWTKGTISPEDGLVEAAKILRKHLNPFVNYFELGQDFAASSAAPEGGAGIPIDDELRMKLERPISDLQLSVRASNCLEAAKIVTIGDLVRCDDQTLLQLRSFGKTSLAEVKSKLAEHNLSLGMMIGGGVGASSETPIPQI